MSLTATAYAFKSYTDGIKELFGFHFKNLIYFVGQGQIEGYKDPDEIIRLKETIAATARNDPKAIKGTLELSKAYSDELHQFVLDATETMSTYTDAELALVFKKFDVIYNRFWTYYHFPIFLLTNHFFCIFSPS